MGFFDKLKTDSWKENSIVINIIDPTTGNKMLDSNGKKAYIEVKSSESQAWKAQLEESARIERNKKSDDINIDKMRLSDCRALAAVTIGCHLPDYTSFKDQNFNNPQEHDQAYKQVRSFLFDVYAEFTKDAVQKMSDNTLFMTESESDSLSEKPIGAGATQGNESLTAVQ